MRTFCNFCTLVTQGTPEKLLECLIGEPSTSDSFYTEDFLLTQRVFLKSPYILSQKCMDWYKTYRLRDRAVHILLLWVNNHYHDFEDDQKLMQFLEETENLLEKDGLFQQLKLLRLAETSRARKRTLILAKPKQEQVPGQLASSWPDFSIIGGWDIRSSIFIDNVAHGSSANNAGLKRRDRIVEVNGIKWDHMLMARAMALIKASNKLEIQAISDCAGYLELKRKIAKQSKTASPEGVPKSKAEGSGAIDTSTAQKSENSAAATNISGTSLEATNISGTSVEATNISGTTSNIPLSTVEANRRNTIESGALKRAGKEHKGRGTGKEGEGKQEVCKVNSAGDVLDVSSTCATVGAVDMSPAANSSKSNQQYVDFASFFLLESFNEFDCLSQKFFLLISTYSSENFNI